MTFEDYIKNPLGGKSSLMTMRDLYINTYREKWDKIKLRENGKIDYELYYSKNDYYVYIKIPSEKVETCYYDVVIQFTPAKNSGSFDSTLKEYEIKFFSNDPNFMFTYCHAFIKNKMFITDLISKMPKDTVKQVAKERNPHDDTGYVKSLVFAYFEIRDKGLFSKVRYKSGVNYDKKILLSKILPAEDKLKERQEKEKSLRKERKNYSKKQDTNDSKRSGPKLTNRVVSNIKNHIITPKKKITNKTKITPSLRSKKR